MAFFCKPLGSLFKTLPGLVHPAALLAGDPVDLAERLPETERAVADRQFRTHFKATPLEVEQHLQPGPLAFAVAVGDGDQFLASRVRSPDDDQDALLLLLHAGAEIDAVHPEIDVTLGREVAPLPAFHLVLPDLLQPGDRGGRKTRRLRPQQRRQRFRKVAGGDALQIQPGQDRLPKTVRFCETDLMTVHKDSFQVQRLEVVNTGRRRRWSVAEKLRIVEESFQGHRQVSATACRHDISPSLLFSWRKAFRRGRDEVIGFAPALIVPDEEAPLGAAAAVGRMEIVTVTGQRIMVGADVDVLALARVVAALEAR